MSVIKEQLLEWQEQDLKDMRACTRPIYTERREKAWNYAVEESQENPSFAYVLLGYYCAWPRVQYVEGE